MCTALRSRMLGRDSQKRPGGEPNARLAEAAAPAEGEGSQLEAAFGVEGHRPFSPRRSTGQSVILPCPTQGRAASRTPRTLPTTRLLTLTRQRVPALLVLLRRLVQRALGPRG
jgi:hypothetical protein